MAQEAGEALLWLRLVAFTHRQTDVTDRYFTRDDVTEEFPFLVSKMAPYYDHWPRTKRRVR